MNDFYVTLPSNSSMDVYPDNAISHYTTQLRQPLQLDGVWEVALVDATIPTGWGTGGEDKKIFWMQVRQQKVKTEEFRRRFYGTEDGSMAAELTWLKCELSLKGVDGIKEFLQVLNRKIDATEAWGMTEGTVADAPLIRKALKGHQYFTYAKGFVTYHPIRGVTLRLPRDLAWMLGLGEGIEDWIIPTSGKATRKVDLFGSYTNIFVYTDIITYQAVGDASAPLLRIIPMLSFTISPRMNHYTHIFTKPHYVPVGRQFIENIHMDLRNDQGEYIPFVSGKCILKVHFRKRSPL